MFFISLRIDANNVHLLLASFVFDHFNINFLHTFMNSATEVIKFVARQNVL